MPRVVGLVLTVVIGGAGCAGKSTWHTIQTANPRDVGHIELPDNSLRQACRAFRQQVVPSAFFDDRTTSSLPAATIWLMLEGRPTKQPGASTASLTTCEYTSFHLNDLGALQVAERRSDKEYAAAVLIDHRGDWIPDTDVDWNDDD
jgi:hypothetical protein